MRIFAKYIFLMFCSLLALPCFGQPKANIAKKIVVSASGKVGGLTAEQFIKNTMANPSFTKGLSAVQQQELAQSLQLALSRQILHAKVSPVLPSVTRLSVHRATQIVGEEYLHAVWSLDDAMGNTVAYLKMGNLSEIERTKEFHETVKDLIPQFDLIDIEYPLVLEEGERAFPPAVEKKIKSDFDTDFFRRYVRESQTRAITPFLLSVVDTRGVTFSKQYHWNSPKLTLSILKDKPITAEEWAQVRGFVRAFNAAGFFHGDIPRNFHLRRGSDGRLKVTILDFERNTTNLNDELFFDEWEELLLEQDCLVL